MKTVSVAINAMQTMGNIGVSEMGVGCLFRSGPWKRVAYFYWGDSGVLWS